MPALTRAEAETRARDLDVTHYAIDLDLTRGEAGFGSTTVIRFAALRDCDTFAEIEPAALHRVLLDGRPLDPALLDDGRLPLTGLTAGEHELRVEADMRYSRTGEGMHRFTDPADGETYLYTQLFLDDVRRVFAAFDQPDLKARFDVAVTAPEHWTVLGNGVATRTAPGRWQMSTTPPLSTYVVAVAAGPYHSVRTEHAGLPFGLHCRRSLAPHLDRAAPELLAFTRRAFDRYHEMFDEPYAFDSYDQAFMPEFNFGAMENPGLVLFRDEYVFRSAASPTELLNRAVVMAHEMAHMWFGDLVTLRWWDDIWLNESFAEYMGYQIVSEDPGFPGAWTDYGANRKFKGSDSDQRPSTHPVAPLPDDVPDTASALTNIDGISYAKGGSALRQLVTWMGREDFLAGVNEHFARHRFGNARLADLIDSLASATGRDVPAWAEAWLRTTGVDTLTPSASPAPGGWRLEIGHHGSRPHRVDVGLYDRDTADPARLVLRERATVDITATSAVERREFGGPRPDLVLLNDGDLSFVKVRFDERSWEAVRDALGSIPDPLARSVAWNAARDLVRDARVAPADYLALVRRHLAAEPEPSIVHGVLTFARTTVADGYLDPALRPDALAGLADTARALLAQEHDVNRLTATRALVDAALTAADAAELRTWYERGVIPGGSVLDADLRWQLLLRLTVLGAAGAADIAAEEERDPTATGREGAARCRAALPDADAKSVAWQAMFHDDARSSYLLTATAQGFWQPEQRVLLDGYPARYYPDAIAVAARRGPVVAETVARIGFPSTAVTADALALGRAALEGPGATPALRRALGDRLDDLGRALRVRQVFGG
ncbi:Membrane alanyl aminopeptidase Metallo peptidase. MEROPS family M01 [Actinacidiphila yanglinensis]|uniref:Aminopeptidase N n=1 Tax=Actinacidiphila yanglinensis TaxID=310779 RepID=A0A1H5TQE5_9ACTN|nr:Membrane alanyl aminopeptidase Metallo peptidase. MEROPS family M01 [Actinacidiphila yanglinensis]